MYFCLNHYQTICTGIVPHHTYEDSLPVAGREVFERYSRRTLTGRLAELLDTVTAG